MNTNVTAHAIVVVLLTGLLITPASPQSTSPGSSPTDRDTNNLDEIVVTGLKRDIKLIDVPNSTDVFDSQKIADSGITQPTDFISLTPNVGFSTSTSNGDLRISIRGDNSIRGAEPAVAVIVDGVQIATSAEFAGALYDLDQIEVFRGPQGAYYGRDTSGGAIVIKTKEPTEEPSGSAVASYGNDNAYSLNLNESGALIPGVLRGSISALSKGTDGSYTNIVTGENVERFYENTLRGRLRFDDGGPLTMDLRMTGEHSTGGAIYYTAKMDAFPGVAPDGTIVHGIPITDLSANNNLNVPFVSDVPGRYERKIFSLAYKADYSFDPATLTSITGYSYNYEINGGKNYPYFNPSDPSTNYFGWAAILGDSTQNGYQKTTLVTQEFRLTSQGKQFVDWQLGFAYLHSVQDYILSINLNGAIPPGLTMADLAGYNGYDATGTRTLVGGGNSVSWPLVIQGVNSPYPSLSFNYDRYTAANYAPFANTTLNFTDAWKLQLAARYDIEQRNVGDITPDISNPFAGGVSYNDCTRYTGETAAQCQSGNNKTFDQIQPKVTLSYRIEDMGSLYASWGIGFKSGGFNLIGTHAASLGAHVAENEGLGQSPTLALANATAETTAQDYYKKEVDNTYEVGAKMQFLDHRLYVAGALFDTEMKDGQYYVFDPVSDVQSIQSIDKERIRGGELEVTGKATDALSLFVSYGYVDARVTELDVEPDYVGHHPPYVPSYTLSVGADFHQPVWRNKTLAAHIEYNETGSTYYSIDNNNEFQRTPFGVANGRLELNGQRWTSAVFARNIFNKQYVNDVTEVIAGAATAYSLAPLRTFGFEFGVKF